MRVIAALFLSFPAHAEVVSQLSTQGKVVALTFDACESHTPAFLDHGISDFLVAEKIPFTIFVTGRFAKRNAADLAALAHLDFVELENHSMNHDNHMDRLSDAAIQAEVRQGDEALFAATGRRSHYFRFPAGNYDAHSLALVESLGYRVVHWTFPSGDPARNVTPERLTQWVLSQAKPGNILIFHINGRGWSTAAALPTIISAFKAKGYRFARLDEALPP